MRLMCTSHNLGSRFRQHHVRLGVLWLALTLGLGFVLTEAGVASRYGFLLAVPLALGCYCLLAGTFGVCVYNGLSGRRMADHGPEQVPDELARRRLTRRGMALAGVSCTLAAAGTLVFVISA